MNRRVKGHPIVLTADRTLMSEYNGAIFLGFSACVTKGLVPHCVYFSMLCPSVAANDDGSVNVAPCGTRKIEASLIGYGFKENDIIVAHPEHLDKAVGPETKVVGITENDPLGTGPATSTFTQIFGGEAYMATKFRELLSHPAIRRYKPRIIVGGPGAWQLEDENVRRDLGVDSVVIGEGEKVAGPLFEKAVKDYPLPPIVHGEAVEKDEIPVVRAAAMNGLVEIARGCGRGCAFCIPTLQKYRCLSLDHILKEVKVNLRAGRQPLLHAEDVLRYKARGLDVNKEAVVDLFRAVKNHPGVEFVSLSHFALASVASAPEVIEEISDIVGASEGRWMSGQTGIETGSPRIMDRHMRGKCKPFAPEDWPQVVVDAFQVLTENNWIPCGTVILGFPGETEKDLDLTISLIERLRPFRSVIIPLFFVSMGGLKGESESFTLDKMTPKHTELFMKCWKHSLDWMVPLYDWWANGFTRNGIPQKGFGLVFNYAVRKSREMIETCEKSYNYDLHSMIADYRNGNRKAMPLPIRLLKTILH